MEDHVTNEDLWRERGRGKKKKKRPGCLHVMKREEQGTVGQKSFKYSSQR